MTTDLVRDVIDLNQRNKVLTEIAYTRFSNQVRGALLDLYFGGIDIPLRLVGTNSQIDSFMTTLTREKRYMDSYLKNGLNDSRTLQSKTDLVKAVARFERETGLRWPFKN